MYKVALIQINNSFADACYLPYTVGLLQSFFQYHSNKSTNFCFLPPIYKRLPVEEAINHIDNADILALSIYIWNFNISLQIAKIYKEKNPDAWIIVGGPQIPNNTESFFEIHPYVDIVCHGEGEVIFKQILEKFPDRNWSDIQSISYIHDGKVIKKKKEFRIEKLDAIPSPYLTRVFDPLMNNEKSHKWIALWETNRGCPYSCAYCYWGASSRSKIVCFAIDRLKSEIQWFSDNKIEFIFCCDANFGILQRDKEIALIVAEMKQKTGYPHALSVQNTKSADRSYEIQKILAKFGLSKGVNLALQSVNEKVLKTIGRRNISYELFKDLQQRYNKDKIETFTDIIIGLPSETYESFVRGIDIIINSGQHNRIQFINLSLLPNTPMSEETFKNKYGLITVESKLVNIHGAPSSNEIIETQSLVIATNSMPLNDWCKTRVYSWMISLLYFDKLLQIPILLISRFYGIAISDIIKSFITENQKNYPIFYEITSFFSKEAENIQRGGNEFYLSKEHLNIYWPHDEYVYIKMSVNGQLDLFYQEAEMVLRNLLDFKKIYAPVWLRDSLDINRMLLKQPFHYENITVKLMHDILETYQALLNGNCKEIKCCNVYYEIDRTTESWNDWLQWCKKVVWYCNKRGAYFYNFVRKN